ncbi:MAG: malonyl CoA-acyl carrier protein transacylase, partial [Anaerolineae bacterium]|nr:malonyl CoA-acyl carrier protein transacylase [Anaerolineae bacterium]
MGKDIANEFAAAREIFDRADAILDFSLSHLCFEGPEEALNDTFNTQPALFTCGVATLKALESV